MLGFGWGHGSGRSEADVKLPTYDEAMEGKRREQEANKREGEERIQGKITHQGQL
jgi:hypothetical protein